jgi:predicted DCC family thiol-disulfide oxidoreductase YuxK
VNSPGAAASRDPAVIVFDSQCVLCSANARLILRRDRKQIFRLASMQGEAGAALLEANGVDPTDPDTIIVVDGARLFRDSDAVLHIYKRLGWPWRALALAAIVPKALRDALYRRVARNRYRWFGKLDECWVPDVADHHRLL